jgi:hypothetical protein
LFSGLSKDATVPSGSFANASFTGAKTVKAPLLLSVSISSAAFTAATKVVKFSFPAAIATIVLSPFNTSVLIEEFSVDQFALVNAVNAKAIPAIIKNVINFLIILSFLQRYFRIHVVNKFFCLQIC